MSRMYHVTTMRAVKRIMVEGLFPRIGRNARAAGEQRPAIYGFRKMEDADNALANWLGELYDEPLAIFTLDISWLALEAHPHEWETRVLEPITTDRIMDVVDEFGVSLMYPAATLAA